MLDTILVTVLLAWLAAASYTDLKTREVPDWMSYSLIAIPLGLNLLYSVSIGYWLNLLHSLVGFGVMFLVGMLMYRARQWGGGDAKLLMGAGAVFGAAWLSFLVNLFIIGALYGLIWTSVLAARHRKMVVKMLKRRLKSTRTKRFVVLLLSVFAIAILFAIQDIAWRIFIAATVLFIVLYQYILVYVQSVELSCMYKVVPTHRLTEGDWLAKNVFLNNKLVCSAKSLGLTKDDIDRLRKSGIDKVMVRQGIPFVPSFLIGAVATLVLGNILLLMI